MKFYSLLSGGISGWWASIEDAMGDATINTIIGISVVFLSLLFISYVISLFKYVNAWEQKRASKNTPVAIVEPEPEPIIEEPEEEMDDLELIAVITAAIHAYEQAQGNENIVEGDLVVRSIRKRNNKWQNA